jgi:Flp pilus assembly protein TadG
MKPPLVRSSTQRHRSAERGVTIVLVALTMVAIMAMAALSIDVVTLYLANAEAQRSADAAALAGARILSISGLTGDPGDTANRWQPACNFAAQVATAVAEQNTLGGGALTNSQVTVTFPNNSDTAQCTLNTAAFGVNPLVSVKVQRTDVPTFFARIWGQSGASVSATATAEAFNSSNSDSVGNGGATGTVIPVQPRCVKPWIVPNLDPVKTPRPFLNDDGTIRSPGIRLNGVGNGVVGETFNLIADCNGIADPCQFNVANNFVNPPQANAQPNTPNLEYLPGQAPVTSSAVPACATATPYEEAIAGCDQSTVYQCGVQSSAAPTPNQVDLAENPTGSLGDTSLATQCLINQAAGPDTLDLTAYPYHFNTGAGNPIVASGALTSGSIVTSSNSIVTLPIYDGNPVAVSGTSPVTIVGFLQVFINNVDTGTGNVNVTVLNVTGCGNGTNAVGTAVSGTSPVPVRLITYP